MALHRCSNVYDVVTGYLTIDDTPRSTETQTSDVDQPFKVVVVSLVLGLTLHRRDDPLLFWCECIARLAKGLFRCMGQEREEDDT